MDDNIFEYVSKFCYLSDMLGLAGRCGEASLTRVRYACGQLNLFAPTLTRSGVPYP